MRTTFPIQSSAKAETMTTTSTTAHRIVNAKRAAAMD
jgi:hypothetical protein